MNPSPAVAISLGALLASWWLTGRVRRYALERRLLDIPNARSSHVMATPRGGGVAIVLTTLAAFLILGFLRILPWQVVTGLAGGGALIAVVGFVDDRGHVPRRWRLLAHVVAAGWTLTCLGGLPPLPVLATVLDLRWGGLALALISLVWLINLTNFMDGIDGIAATETITVTLGGVCLYQMASPGNTQWVAPLVLAAATVGFLVWNWPPAKIFMGDAGSGFLGLMMGGLAVQAAWAMPTLLWSWVILVGVFAVDATLTLMRRGIRGERVYQAHRSHAYQRAAHRWASHKQVTVAVGAINVIWLLPCALLVALGILDGVIGVVVAYAPLIAGALWLRAGVADPV